MTQLDAETDIADRRVYNAAVVSQCQDRQFLTLLLARPLGFRAFYRPSDPTAWKATDTGGKVSVILFV
ncbi:MAG: hypothetical protein IPH23_06705 [Gammaproteobacteria bacterium]|nr:hypothetical protein [Gammaproteobacteria bacterium]